MTSRAAGPTLIYDPDASYPVSAIDLDFRQIGTERLGATVYQPDGPGPFPLLLDLHGGGWELFDRHRDAPVDEELASHGLVVAALDFRLKDQAPHPAGMQDINFGVRWFKARAEEFNASGRNVGMMGFSSGGHQVVLSGLRPRHSRYATERVGSDVEPDADLNYVVSCGCIFDLVKSLAGAPDREINRLRVDEYFGSIESIVDASPQHILESREEVSLPPLLVVQAGADDLSGGEATDAARFAVSYARRGGLAELAIIPGAPHIFLNPGLVPRTEGMLRGQDAIKHFIARQVRAPELGVDAPPALGGDANG